MHLDITSVGLPLFVSSLRAGCRVPTETTVVAARVGTPAIVQCRVSNLLHSSIDAHLDRSAYGLKSFRSNGQLHCLWPLWQGFPELGGSVSSRKVLSFSLSSLHQGGGILFHLGGYCTTGGTLNRHMMTGWFPSVMSYWDVLSWLSQI